MPFAEVADIQKRLMRTLSTEETAAAEFLLDAVTAEITLEADREAVDLEDVDALRFLSVEVVCREMANPVGAQSVSEGLGAHNYTIRYRETGGTFLTEDEKRQVRLAVHGTLSGSPRMESMADDLIDLAEARDVGEDA